MATKFVLIALCICVIATVCYVQHMFRNIGNAFSAVTARFDAMDKMLEIMNRQIDTHTEAFHDTFSEIGKAKHDYERLRCYVYNNVPQYTDTEEEGAENAD